MPNMKKALYYTAPDDLMFEEMKLACLTVWREMDNTHGYVDEKISRIKDTENVKDNFMYMLAMFDLTNMRKVTSMLSEDTKNAVTERIVDSGGTPYFIHFIGLGK